MLTFTSLSEFSLKGGWRLVARKIGDALLEKLLRNQVPAEAGDHLTREQHKGDLWGVENQ